MRKKSKEDTTPIDTNIDEQEFPIKEEPNSIDDQIVQLDQYLQIDQIANDNSDDVEVTEPCKIIYVKNLPRFYNTDQYRKIITQCTVSIIYILSRKVFLIKYVILV